MRWSRSFVTANSVDLPTPPPLSPTRGPPQANLGFDSEYSVDLDQTPAFDPADPEPAPDLQRDQARVIFRGALSRRDR